MKKDAFVPHQIICAVKHKPRDARFLKNCSTDGVQVTRHHSRQLLLNIHDPSQSNFSSHSSPKGSITNIDVMVCIMILINATYIV